MQVTNVSVVVSASVGRVLECFSTLPAATALLDAFDHRDDEHPRPELVGPAEVDAEPVRWSMTDASGRAGSMLVQAAGSSLTRVAITMEGMAARVDEEAPATAADTEDHVRRLLDELRVAVETVCPAGGTDGVVLDLSDIDDLDYLATLGGAASRTLLCLRRGGAPVPPWFDTVTAELARSCSVVVITLPARGDTFTDCRGEIHQLPGPDVAAVVRGVARGSMLIESPGYYEFLVHADGTPEQVHLEKRSS